MKVIKNAGIEAAKAALHAYKERYEDYWLDGMRQKVGLKTPHDEDKALIEELLNSMAANRADFTLTFYYLSKLVMDSTHHDNDVRALFDAPEQFDVWAMRWRARLQKDNGDDATRQSRMRAVNPAYIPRNHLIEATIRAAEDNGDFSAFHELHTVLQKPFERRPQMDTYMLPPEPHEVVQQTFCGT